MEYTLKNGKTLLIKESEPEDAEAIIYVMKTADIETEFLARNPGEFKYTVEDEKNVIARIHSNPDITWFNPVYEGKVVGQCSVLLVQSNERFRHRATCAFVLLKEYWGLGIGGKMMEECIKWCKERNIEQLELEVVEGNNRALNMYKSFGFEITGTLPRALKYPDGIYRDEYKMVKFL